MNADLVIETCHRFALFSEAQWQGEFVVCNADTAEGLCSNAELMARARAFGRELVA